MRNASLAWVRSHGFRHCLVVDGGQIDADRGLGAGVVTGRELGARQIKPGQRRREPSSGVEVARLQSEQQRLLNQTLTAEQLTKQYLEVLHDMKNSNNLVILVPTTGGVVWQTILSRSGESLVAGGAVAMLFIRLPP